MFHCHVGSRRIDHAVLRGALSPSLSLSFSLSFHLFPSLSISLHLSLFLSLSLLDHTLTTMGSTPSTLRTTHPERFGSSDSIAGRQEWTKRQTVGGERGGNETDVWQCRCSMIEASLCYYLQPDEIRKPVWLGFASALRFPPITPTKRLVVHLISMR